MRGTDAGPLLDSIRCEPLPTRPARRHFTLRRGASGAVRETETALNAETVGVMAPVECADLERTLSLLEEFSEVQHVTARRQTERALATVLFTDIVGSTAHAAVLGDRAWREVLDRHDRIAQSAVSACAGRLIKRTGDGILATFDVPAHGLECAKTLRAALAHGEISIRAGVHTGEVELRDGDVAGIGVNIAARVAALAASREVLVSRTVRDLVAGGGYAFTSRGSHALKGVPGRWELLAVS
jgi:class 3 adenylate cyclase